MHNMNDPATCLYGSFLLADALRCLYSLFLAFSPLSNTWSPSFPWQATNVHIKSYALFQFQRALSSFSLIKMCHSVGSISKISKIYLYHRWTLAVWFHLFLISVLGSVTQSTVSLHCFSLSVSITCYNTCYLPCMFLNHRARLVSCIALV